MDDANARKLEETAITTLDHVRNKNFRKEIVKLDGKKFSNCSFDRCILEYSGGDTEIGFRCSTTGIRPRFKGAAARTVRLLHALGLLSFDPFAESDEWPKQNATAAD
ncbi:MAG TPA: hypothetical protein VN788_10025 [Verrucomicrobiae bacterium]|nr:hypothetical protein [Verrucomicrobiae bacterium]